MQASKPVVGLSQSHVDVNDALQGLKPAQSELNHSLDSVKDNQIETEPNIVDPSSKDYLRLLALYREKQGLLWMRASLISIKMIMVTRTS